MSVWFLLPLGFLCSIYLTSKIRLYALAHSLIDVPNVRSSHSIPTPRGGGVAIVISFLILLPLVATAGYVTWSHVIGILGAGGGIALLGFLDDHGHIAARWRLLGHFSAASWSLYWIAGLPSLTVFGMVFNFGFFSYIIVPLVPFLVFLVVAFFHHKEHKEEHKGHNGLIFKNFSIHHYLLCFFIKGGFVTCTYCCIGHYGCYRMIIACFNRCICLLTAADAFHPVADMI